MRLRLGPGARGGGDVAGAVLRLPGEALAHRVPYRSGSPKRSTPSRSPVSQAPLTNCTTPTRQPSPERAQNQAEGGGRLALARAGMDDQQPLLDDRLGGDLGVLRRLALRHLRLVAVGVFVHVCPREGADG